jgi:prepilin signal peptidase PulO-like enzyme (type II secretory pathway)
MTLLLAVLLGLVLGSFGTMVLHRMPQGESFGGRSHCPHCGHTLRLLELLPLVSFLLQRGRCRSCHQPISWRYPLFETLSALVLALLVLTHRETSLLELLVLGGTAELLLFIAFYDAETQRIPDSFTALLVLFALASHALPLETVPLHELREAVLGLLTLLAFFGSLWILSRGSWIGSGDVFLGGAIGLLLGWPEVLVALLLTYSLGGITAAVFLLLGLVERKSRIPFAPFLCSGALLLLFGETLL